MKKFISIFISIILSCSIWLLYGCNSSSGDEPVYSTEFEYDTQNHWKPLLEGSSEDPEYIEFGAHKNKKGKCECGYYFPCPYLSYLPNEEGTGLICYGASDPNAYSNEELLDSEGEFSVADVENNWLHVEVPVEAVYNGETYPVVGLSEYAFKNDPILSIKLNEGLVSIGDQAFAYNANLKEIVLPDSVSVIGYSLCYFTPGIEKFTYGKNSPGCPGYSFYRCSNLKNVYFGENVSYIGVLAFNRCTSLEYLVFPQNLTRIDVSSPGLPKDSFHGPFGTVNSSAIFYMEHQTLPSGFHYAWNPDGIRYFLKGQWEYGEDGKPKIK